MKRTTSFHSAASRSRLLTAPLLFLPLAFVTVAPAQQPDTRQAADADASQAQFENRHFEAPERLMVGDQPLNAETRQMYPSPAVYDVDSDGQAELVVGDIFGSLQVYENQNTSGKGDPVWGKPTRLETAEGTPIKVPNW